jgi:hypothetical protein
MKWRAFGVAILSAAAAATSAEATDWSWKNLSKLNDPAGTPTVRAAKVATQGLSRQEMTQRLAALRLAEVKSRSTMGGEQRIILRREIKLLEIGLESK